jgi:hypothetical protein
MKGGEFLGQLAEYQVNRKKAPEVTKSGSTVSIIR